MACRKSWLCGQESYLWKEISRWRFERFEQGEGERRGDRWRGYEYYLLREKAGFHEEGATPTPSSSLPFRRKQPTKVDIQPLTMHIY